MFLYTLRYLRREGQLAVELPITQDPEKWVQTTVDPVETQWQTVMRQSEYVLFSLQDSVQGQQTGGQGAEDPSKFVEGF